ncbi:hypothetical protein L6452_13081 [Arctium lappa]|uniref:Uncharacterized protein n=1 Tax=Arctium lappa TaxID=4217 RepID=A0ACB9CHA4_ARCLA|nr:hypothetical protein L6452_13081 [Arctium lappa]
MKKGKKTPKSFIELRMAWRTYGNNKYPTYTNAPVQEGGYAYGPKQPGNWHIVATTTIEGIRAPTTRYINFGDQEYNHGPSTLINPKYAPKDHHEGYEPDYGSDNENSSPPRNHGRESLMDKFLNKVQIKTSRPVKTSELSSPNKYQPTSPVHNYPSEEAYPIKTRNLSGPNKHQSTSPEHSYPQEGAHMIRTKSLPDPNKYKTSSPERSYPSEEAHEIRTKNLSGPNKYKSSSPKRSYPSEQANQIRPKNFPGPNKYQPTGPMHGYPSKETHLNRTRNLSGPNMYQPTNPLHNYPSDEHQLIRTRLGPNNHHPSIPGSKIGQLGHFSDPKNHWQSAGPPMTHHPLTNVTNDFNEALSFLEEYMNYSPPRTGVFDNYSQRPQSIQPEWQYARPTFAGTTTTNLRTNIIDCQEAIRKYQGTRVP